MVTYWAECILGTEVLQVDAAIHLSTEMVIEMGASCPVLGQFHDSPHNQVVNRWVVSRANSPGIDPAFRQVAVVLW